MPAGTSDYLQESEASTVGKPICVLFRLGVFLSLLLCLSRLSRDLIR
jgi:hypothetical protein